MPDLVWVAFFRALENKGCSITRAATLNGDDTARLDVHDLSLVGQLEDLLIVEGVRVFAVVNDQTL